MDYETLKIIAVIIGIIGGLIGVWKFLIQPIWRVVNSILETLKEIETSISGFGKSIAVFQVIIPRIEKDIDGLGNRINGHDKRLIDLERKSS